MKTKNILILAALVVALISLFYSFQGSQDQTAYVNEIQKEREEKNEFMRTSKESPLVDKTADFKGLHYFGRYTL